MLHFEPGYWSEYEDYKYAGYVGDACPEGMPPKRVAKVGWDVSHFRRMVHLLLALERGREVMRSDFSAAKYMAGYGNAVAKLMWNGDVRKPNRAGGGREQRRVTVPSAGPQAPGGSRWHSSAGWGADRSPA